ncbi:MAG: helix-turn-helix domain-containing protein, partial [Candidatus Eremiobacteraeota bacterium]|nr:helix-turn-helix domain-containing protein [Candidatus Eremiobacteraeota bacterium]
MEQLSSSDFGTLLRRYRIAAGLSQEALAERARVSTNGISALERGYRRTPQRETLALLVGALALDEEQRREFEAAARSEETRRIGTSAVAAGPWQRSIRSNLPLALTSLIGREHDVTEVADLLGHRRLLTLVGSGGVGKTRVALQVGADRLDGSNDGVWFVDLAPLSDPASVINTIASTLGLHEQGERPMLDVLLQYLRPRRLLLILDNCEHVIEEAARTADAILRAAPHVRLLATSREALRIGGEHVYRVPSLDVPSEGSIAVEDALRYGAVALFAERAAASDAKFRLTDESAPIVAEICRRLDGIALAIELAAARVKVLAPHQLAKKLDERFRLLTGGNRTALPRQQTMRALIDWSYGLLSEPEQRLFRRVAIFVGGWTLEGAE